MKMLWDWPLGELILFNCDAEVKMFFSKMNIRSVEELNVFGITIKNEDKITLSEAQVLPIFNPNPLLEKEEDNHSTLEKAAFCIDTEDMVVDNNIYSSYPCIAFIKEDEKYYTVLPFSEIKSPTDFEEEEMMFGERWIKNRAILVELQKQLRQTQKK